jgi:hypothetical protein
MPCYKPLQAYRSIDIGKSGKRRIVFKEEDALPLSQIQLPCGQCIGCRLDTVRQWATRCIHESQLYRDNCFITLTYDDDHLPRNCGLDKRDFQLFMKRLRKKYKGKKIRYYMCGEYGGKSNRPHYHALLFNHDFEDKVYFKTQQGTNKDSKLYLSAELMELWQKGNTSIGDVTYDSAAYVARYVLKKINVDEKTPENLLRRFERFDSETGEILTVEPEYTSMSLKPGIGADWYEKYQRDVFPHDYVIVNGKKQMPPKYYDNKYPEIDEIKIRRIAKVMEKRHDFTTDRLAVKEKIQQCNQQRRNQNEGNQI